MGVTVKTFGPAELDRNIARLEVFSEGENRDDWRIVVHFQDALYAAAERVTDPTFGSERVDVTYGAIKNLPLPSGGKVSDLFGPIRALGYALRRRATDEKAQGGAGE
jgi:hypothetical protein